MKICNKIAFFEESLIYLITRSGQLCTNFIILSYLRLKTGTEWARWKLFIMLPVYIGNALNGILMSPEVIFRAKLWLSPSQVYWVTLWGHRAAFSSASLHLPMRKCKLQWMKSSPTQVNNHIIRRRLHTKPIPAVGLQHVQSSGLPGGQGENTWPSTVLLGLVHFMHVLSLFIAINQDQIEYLKKIVFLAPIFVKLH